jgi:GDP-mannose 6-dehydrogenase
VGVDVDPQKLSLIRNGRSPVTEPGLDDLLMRMLDNGRVHVTNDAVDTVQRCQVSLVCVGTPSRRNGSLETDHLERVIDQIGHALARTSSYHVVAIRSTVLPGVWSSRLLPLLERASGRGVGADLGLCINPEFLREGSAIRDFDSPPFTVIGESDSKAGDLLLSLYAHVKAPVHRVHPDEASMIKYASNNFHAVKVAFSNEIGALCQQFGIDGQTVMQIFCEDRDLNISPRYLRPGFGFGGSCLPKDLRAVVHAAKERDVATPLLGSVLTSNDAHIQRVVDAVLEMRGRRAVALLGLSFKAGSDDLRESPFVRLAESLIGKGVPLRIFDPDVTLSQVFGRNEAYIQEHIPHVAQLMGDSFNEVVRGADVVIVGKHVRGVKTLKSVLRSDQIVIDLVGIRDLGAAIRPWAALCSTASV